MKYFIFSSIKYCSIQVFLQALHSGTYLKPQAILEACLQTLARYCVKTGFFYILFWDGLMSGLIVFWTIFCYAAQMTIHNPSLSIPMLWDYRNFPPTKLQWSFCRAWVRRLQPALIAAMSKILQGPQGVLIPFSMSVNWLPSVTWHLKVCNFSKSLSHVAH